MLPLDHVPFYTGDLEALTRAFLALGFVVSPRGDYTSPEYPDANWTSHAVFLRKGWLDLQHNPQASSDAPVGPRAGLFLTNDLDAAAACLSGFRTRPTYRLERRWKNDLGLPSEAFALFDIGERISPVGLAVIQHHYPCHDTLAAWFDHPNSAEEVAGLIFGAAEPGPMAGQAACHLDISGFRYWDEAKFKAAFGHCEPQVALRVRVGSLTKVRAALDIAGIAFVETPDGLHVTPPRPLACGFQFFQSLPH